MGYEMFEWKYRDLRRGVSFVVYARTRETADEIIAVANTDSRYCIKPAIFGFKKKVLCDVPPYDFEQDQLAEAKRQLEYRRKRWETHPEERPGYKKKTRVK